MNAARLLNRAIAVYGLFAILLIVIILLLAFTSPGYAGTAATALLSPLPEKTPIPQKPATWVAAAKGGELRFGSVVVAAPAGFTRQSGADIRVNLLPQAEGLTLPANFVAGTLFAFGIWPANDQTEFEQPLDVRLQLNPVSLSEAEMRTVQFVQYDPAQQRWLALNEVFRPATYELITKVQRFTPVAKDFPTWGGRTFFAVVRSAASPATTAATEPVTLRQANIRSGPGTTYAVVRSVQAGEPLTLDGRLADGSWLRLADGSWIAAFLVANAPQLPVVDAE